MIYFTKNAYYFHFRKFQRSSVIRQIDPWVVKYFVMAFTLHDVLCLLASKNCCQCKSQNLLALATINVHNVYNASKKKYY